MTVGAALAVLLVLNPVALAAGTHVNPDSQLPLAGLILYLLGRRTSVGPGDLSVLVVTTAVLVSIDAQMGLALILVGAVVGSQLVSGVVTYRQRGASGLPYEILSPSLRLGALTIGGLAGPAFIMMLRRWYSGSDGARTTTIPRDEWFPRPSFSIEILLGNCWTCFPPVSGGYLIPPLRGVEYAALVELLGVLIAGGVVAFLFSRRSTSSQGEALAIVIVGVLAFPILHLLLWSRGGSFWTLSPRDAIAPLAVYFFVTGLAASNRVSRAVIVALASALLALYLLSTLSFDFNSFSSQI